MYLNKIFMAVLLSTTSLAYASQDGLVKIEAPQRRQVTEENIKAVIDQFNPSGSTTNCLGCSTSFLRWLEYGKVEPAPNVKSLSNNMFVEDDRLELNDEQAEELLPQGEREYYTITQGPLGGGHVQIYDLTQTTKVFLRQTNLLELRALFDGTPLNSLNPGSQQGYISGMLCLEYKKKQKVQLHLVNFYGYGVGQNREYLIVDAQKPSIRKLETFIKSGLRDFNNEGYIWFATNPADAAPAVKKEVVAHLVTKVDLDQEMRAINPRLNGKRPDENCLDCCVAFMEWVHSGKLRAASPEGVQFNNINVLEEKAVLLDRDAIEKIPRFPHSMARDQNNRQQIDLLNERRDLDSVVLKPCNSGNLLETLKTAHRWHRHGGQISYGLIYLTYNPEMLAKVDPKNLGITGHFVCFYGYQKPDSNFEYLVVDPQWAESFTIDRFKNKLLKDHGFQDELHVWWDDPTKQEDMPATEIQVEDVDVEVNRHLDRLMAQAGQPKPFTIIPSVEQIQQAWSVQESLEEENLGPQPMEISDEPVLVFPEDEDSSSSGDESPVSKKRALDDEALDLSKVDIHQLLAAIVEESPSESSKQVYDDERKRPQMRPMSHKEAKMADEESDLLPDPGVDIDAIMAGLQSSEHEEVPDARPEQWRMTEQEKYIHCAGFSSMKKLKAYFLPDGVLDYQRLFHLTTLAQTDYKAMYYLGILYLGGEIEKDKKTANQRGVKYIDQAAKGGFLPAISTLAERELAEMK